MRTIYIISLILTIIGALNWGMIALFDFNLVSTLFGERTLVTMLVYGLVGLSGLINLGLLVELFEKM